MGNEYIGWAQQSGIDNEKYPEDIQWQDVIYKNNWDDFEILKWTKIRELTDRYKDYLRDKFYLIIGERKENRLKERLPWNWIESISDEKVAKIIGNIEEWDEKSILENEDIFLGNLKYQLENGLIIHDWDHSHLDIWKFHVKAYKWNNWVYSIDVWTNPEANPLYTWDAFEYGTYIWLSKNLEFSYEEQNTLNNNDNKYNFNTVNEKISCYSAARSDYAIWEDDSFRWYKKWYHTRWNYYQNWKPEDFYIYSIDESISSADYFKHLVNSGQISNYVYSHQSSWYITFKKEQFSQQKSLLTMISLIKKMKEQLEKKWKRYLTKEGFNWISVAEEYERDLFDKKIALKTAKNLRRIWRKYDKPELRRVLATEVFPSNKIKNEELEKKEQKLRWENPFYYLFEDMKKYNDIKVFFEENFSVIELNECKQLLWWKSIVKLLEEKDYLLDSDNFILWLILEKKFTWINKNIDISFIKDKSLFYWNEIIDLFINLWQLTDKLILKFIDEDIWNRNELFSNLSKENHDTYILNFLKKWILTFETLYYFPKESVINFINISLSNRMSEWYKVLEEYIAKKNESRDKNEFFEIQEYKIYLDNNKKDNLKIYSLYNWSDKSFADNSDVLVLNKEELKVKILDMIITKGYSCWDILMQVENPVNNKIYKKEDYIYWYIIDFIKEDSFLKSIWYTGEDIIKLKDKKVIVYSLNDWELIDMFIEKRSEWYEIYSFDKFKDDLKYYTEKWKIFYLWNDDKYNYIIRYDNLGWNDTLLSDINIQSEFWLNSLDDEKALWNNKVLLDSEVLAFIEDKNI